MSRLHQLSQLGQSVWIDFLSRDLLDSGSLARAVRHRRRQGQVSSSTRCATAKAAFAAGTPQ